MDKIEPISNVQLIQKYVEFHLSIVMNTFDFLIKNQEPFKIVVHDPSRKYSDFAEDIYTDDYVVLDIMNWSLEVSSIDKELPYLYTTLVFGETPVDVTIDAIDIARIFIMKNAATPLYARFFVPMLQQSVIPEPQRIAIDTSEFEHTNAEGIAHSMSCLTLCTLQETTNDTI
jgi:hypothetical protein